MRAALYARISSDRTGEGLGVERQREDCEQLITQRGWTLTETFVENDTSAAGRKPRPVFEALLAAVQAGRVDVVVAWAMDRLTRNARDRLRLAEACQARQVKISLVQGTDMDPTTAQGRLVIGMFGEMAQFEIDQKSDRQRRAQLQAAEQGRRSGGRRPFGYDLTGMAVEPREAAAIVTAYRDVQAGVALADIARRWNTQGLNTGKRRYAPGRETEQSRWTHDTVRKVLLNPRNCGQRRHKGTIMKGVTAQWPAIIDEATFLDVTDLLTNPDRRCGTPGAQQLLTGVARCGVCELTVHGGGAKHGKPLYRCRSSRHVSRLAAPVDAYVRETTAGFLAHADLASLLVDQGRPDLDELRARTRALEGRLAVLAAEFGDSTDVSPAEYRAMTAPVRAQLRQVRDEMADAGKARLLGRLVDAEDPAGEFLALGVAEQRPVIAELFTVELLLVGRGARTFRVESVRMSRPGGLAGASPGGTVGA